ncbi:MAG: type I restriction enzyme HsdR N-terminal domain-containing protein [Phaeodactylibacter sp.]|nr:type I restriction enzyme HsdR N-terminal domain-containing protein [Phaeodactylibacter sp.]MCB9275959.1 type I restriction enzyme HsdR N-terminal domain-containing protein [Lewinellaceae bacterium]
MLLDLGLMRFKSLLKVKRENDKRLIFDPARKKWVALQPEELVRQLFIQYLVAEKGYSLALINTEKGLKVNTLSKRFDLLVYDRGFQPFFLVECKAPQVAISQDVFRQAAWYNMPLKVSYLLVTNGIESYCCHIDYERQAYEFLDGVPDME